jgi:RNA 2',3'-cyclic 3'-phosphodiesterase
MDVDFSDEQAIENETKRLFFGAQVTACWPQELPSGRIIDEEMRHITLAFLGQNDYPALEKTLDQAPLPPFRIGMGGIGTELLFLPKEQARVVALNISWLEDPHPLFSFQRDLSQWLEEAGYTPKKHSFLPHITIARTPFEKEQWKNCFEPVPFFLTAIHLYESLGHLNYRSLWKVPLMAPFTELDHTADIAFTIRATSMQQLFLHAQLALFFSFPPLSQFYTPSATETLDAIIIELNRMIALADEERGCPFKAVSFHGSIVKHDGLFTWEMIVDV